MKNVFRVIVAITVMGTFTLAGAFGCAPAQQPDDEVPAEDEHHPVEEHAPEEQEEAAVEEEDETEPVVATARVMSGEGEHLGDVTFTQIPEGVLIEGRIEGLEPGPKGFHVHEFGECEAPDFLSAGGHFNPQGHPHGAHDAADDERHAGDFGNIDFDENGVATISIVDEVITLGGEENDVLGQALIVHAEEDDLETQPTGDAGPRAGCGLIEMVEQPAAMQ